MVPPDSPQQAGQPDALDLLDRAIRGDRRAYAHIARLVSGYLNAWRADDFRADWEDIIQEVLLSAVAARREGRIPNGHALRAFLKQAARFKFIDRVRKSARRPTSTFDDAGPFDSAEAADLSPWPPKPDIEERAHEIRLTVANALEELDERQQMAIVEVYLRGHTYGEAASRTGIPLGTLKRLLRTGMERLRERLDGP